MSNILIIKHGSLGDIIFALPSMISIRKKYPDTLIYLLTENKEDLKFKTLFPSEEVPSANRTNLLPLDRYSKI